MSIYQNETSLPIKLNVSDYYQKQIVQKTN